MLQLSGSNISVFSGKAMELRNSKSKRLKLQEKKLIKLGYDQSK